MASVESGDTTYDVRAREASAAERSELLDRIVRTKGIREEIEHTPRQMPVMILQLLGVADHRAPNGRRA